MSYPLADQLLRLSKRNAVLRKELATLRALVREMVDLIDRMRKSYGLRGIWTSEKEANDFLARPEVKAVMEEKP